MEKLTLPLWITIAAGSLLPASSLAADQTDVLSMSPAVVEYQLEPRSEDSQLYPFSYTTSAPKDAPNVLLVLTDDVGFGASSTFGGSIPTPNLDRIAQEGLIYNRFHTTGVCAPTRAALLTGRNHHAVGAGHHPEMSSPYPGYTGVISRRAASIARILRDNGYNTAMFGKDHNTPAEHRSQMGPFDFWPTSRGFERFYGFLSGDTDQFNPALFSGTQPVDTSARPEGYLLDRDLVDKAISWMHNQQSASPETPFFIYYAPGSAHAPQQAPSDWIEKFRGVFDHGWDEERLRILGRQKGLGIIPETTELAQKPDAIPDWTSLNEEEKTVYARFMEVYAAMLAYQDHQFGRLVDEMRRIGVIENTLIIFIQGDNGGAVANGVFGSMNEMLDMSRGTEQPHYDVSWLAKNLHFMGGKYSYQAIPAGWSFTINTPFPWFKRVASHLGAVRNGLVISWPAKIQQFGLRNQYHHVIDIFPTILSAAQINSPTTVDGLEQLPVDGKSMLYSFSNPKAASPRTTQYYEISGNHALYHRGWLANSSPEIMPWERGAFRGAEASDYNWELYNLSSDFSQSQDLAERNPDRLSTLQKIFDDEARANRVYPLQNTTGRQRAEARGALNSTRKKMVMWGNNVQVAERLAPPIFSRPFTIEVQMEIPTEGAQGVVFAAGSRFGGWSFYFMDGKPVVVASRSPLDGGEQRIVSQRPLSPGFHTVTWEVDYDGDQARIRVREGEAMLSEGTIHRRPRRMAGQGETFDSGRDTNVPVSSSYSEGGRFNGEILRLEVRLN